MNKSFRRSPVKVKVLTAENSSWVRSLEMRKAKKLLSASKHEILKPESVKPAAAGVALTASLTDEQIAAVAGLDFVTKKEIRDEFKTKNSYVAYKLGEASGRIKFHGPQYRTKVGF